MTLCLVTERVVLFVYVFRNDLKVTSEPLALGKLWKLFVNFD